MSATLPLRDIQVPLEPGWWPPAPGWWFVAAVVMTLMVLLGARLFRSWRQRQRQRQRLRWLAAELAAAGSHGPARIAAASEVLRRLARRDAPQALVLQGEAWLAYLDGDSTDAPFTRGPGRLLLDGAYRPQVDQAQVDAALLVVRQRIEHGLP